MSLSQALSAAISGLQVNQAGLALVAANVSNADTPGYIRKTVTQVATAGNGTGISVRMSGVQRELDSYVQSQLRTENSGASYATTRSQALDQLQDVYGTPIELFSEYTFAKADRRPGAGITPLKLGHVARFVTDALAGERFYGEVLRFRTSDWRTTHSVFMRCGHYHHNPNEFA